MKNEKWKMEMENGKWRMENETRQGRDMTRGSAKGGMGSRGERSVAELRVSRSALSGATALTFSFFIFHFSFLLVPVSAQDRPLPDPKTLGAEVRTRMLTDRELQSQYTFIERREEISISKLGKVTAGPVKTYEVYPSVERGNTYKRLIAIDGVPLPPEELARRDRVHREDLLREAAKREREPPQERQRRLQKEAKEQAEWNRTLDEVFELYDIRLVGRDTIEGAVCVVATLEPKPGYQPRTDAGKLMKKLRARAWVSEADYQIVKVVAEAIDDVTYGWGLLGRLHEGTVATFERTKVNGEVWLPRRVEIKGTGRALFRRFMLNSVTTYSDYRKFNVSTGETFSR
jgi:hypothetical protein